jgi:hypothetical protein
VIEKNGPMQKNYELPGEWNLWRLPVIPGYAGEIIGKTSLNTDRRPGRLPLFRLAWLRGWHPNHFCPLNRPAEPAYPGTDVIADLHCD